MAGSSNGTLGWLLSSKPLLIWTLRAWRKWTTAELGCVCYFQVFITECGNGTFEHECNVFHLSKPIDKSLNALPTMDPLYKNRCLNLDRVMANVKIVPINISQPFRMSGELKSGWPVGERRDNMNVNMNLLFPKIII